MIYPDPMVEDKVIKIPKAQMHSIRVEAHLGDSTNSFISKGKDLGTRATMSPIHILIVIMYNMLAYSGNNK